jgi:hypothetical protein
MHTEDRLKDAELRIIRELYERGKKPGSEVSFKTESHELGNVLSGLGMTEASAKPALQNLKEFDFIEWDEGRVKLLPSGIKYSLGQFDGLQ